MTSNTSWVARALIGTGGGNDTTPFLLGFRNFFTDGNIRPLLGTNSHVSDNKILRSWQYIFFLLCYCVICSLTGILSVSLLPDPSTLEAIRAEEQQVDYDETMEAAAHNMQGAYETYGESSYQYALNDAAHQSGEYGDYTSNYISPEQERGNRFSRSMTGVRSNAYPISSRRGSGGYTSPMDRQNGGYTRNTGQQNGGYRRTSERQNNGNQRPMTQQSSSYSSLSAEDDYNRPMKSQYRATPRPQTEMETNGYAEPENGKGNDGIDTMPQENKGSYTEASNSSMTDTTEVPSDSQKEEEEEDLIPNYGFLENSLYAKYLEFYNKQKEFFEEHFGYFRKGSNKNKGNKEEEEEEEMTDEDEEVEGEQVEGGYTEQPIEEEPSENSYPERPMYQGPSVNTTSERPVSQPTADSYKRHPTLPPPTHWVLVPQQFGPPYQTNRPQAPSYRPQLQEQESQSQRYRLQPQQEESQSQRYMPQASQYDIQSQEYRPLPQREESQSKGYRPQPQQQESQSQRYKPILEQVSQPLRPIESKSKKQYQTLKGEMQSGRPAALGNSQVSSHFQKIYLSSEESSNIENGPSRLSYSGHYSNVNGVRVSQPGNHTSASQGVAQEPIEPAESSYLSYKPHSEK